MIVCSQPIAPSETGGQTARILIILNVNLTVPVAPLGP
jgi:hypothetical protein